MASQVLKNTFLFAIITLLISCSSYMHGYTQLESLNRYLIVDESKKSFGYKRMTYNIALNNSLEGFVKNNGYPDFIYEYKNEKSRDSIKMYYIEKDTVYIYESDSWIANSLYLKENRPLTEYEKATYNELKK